MTNNINKFQRNFNQKRSLCNVGISMAFFLNNDNKVAHKKIINATLPIKGSFLWIKCLKIKVIKKPTSGQVKGF